MCFFGGSGGSVGAYSGVRYMWVFLLLLLGAASCFAVGEEFCYLRGGSGVFIFCSGRLVRLVVPAGDSLGETTSAPWNKVLRISLSLVGVVSDAGVRCSARWIWFGGLVLWRVVAGGRAGCRPLLFFHRKSLPAFQSLVSAL
jgi:hypothetical protein